jgi:SsrA-binding protein
VKIITKNKKAYFDYQILDKLEAGIVLTGDEVKSLRAGAVNLTGSFATIHNGEMFILNCNITPYSNAYQKDEEKAKRSRKLLLHRKEIEQLVGDISCKGIVIVPLMLYFNEKSKIKVELGLCKHKKSADKRQSLKEKDIKRDASRELKHIVRY